MYHWQFASGHEKSASWYVAALVVVLFFVVYGIITGAYLMSVAAFLFAGVYIMIENNSTPLTDVHVTENGIQVESTFYPYGDLVSFALVYEEHIPRLLRLSLRKGISTTIDIPLTSDVNPQTLRSFLGGYLEESDKTEFSKTDRVIRAMRL